MDTEISGIGMTSNRTRQRLANQLRVAGIIDAAVLSVMTELPRHLFIDEALSHRAYENTSLPIGLGQTISQPYIVAKMTELLLSHAPSQDKVLEVGTGSGYQAAVLSKFFKTVYSVERLIQLSNQARERLNKLRIYNVKCKVGNGAEGWSVNGPFDAIIVTAAAQDIPQVLLKQMAIGGVMVVPVGESNQALYLIKRISETEYDSSVQEPVKFVPLIEI